MYLPKRGVAVIGSALLAVAVLSAAPAAASPHPVRPAVAPENCTIGNLCTYQNMFFNVNGGTQWNFNYNTRSHNVWIYVGDAANDKITSLVNDRNVQSSIAENKIQITADKCANIDGNGGNEGGSAELSDLSFIRWSDGNKMNDSISAIELQSTPFDDCDQFFPSG